MQIRAAEDPFPAHLQFMLVMLKTTPVLRRSDEHEQAKCIVYRVANLVTSIVACIVTSAIKPLIKDLINPR